MRFQPLPADKKPDYSADDRADAERRSLLQRVVTLAGMASVERLTAAEEALRGTR